MEDEPAGTLGILAVSLENEVLHHRHEHEQSELSRRITYTSAGRVVAPRQQKLLTAIIPSPTLSTIILFFPRFSFVPHVPIRSSSESRSLDVSCDRERETLGSPGRGGFWVLDGRSALSRRGSVSCGTNDMMLLSVCQQR